MCHFYPLTKGALRPLCCLSQCTLVIQEKMVGFAWRLEGGRVLGVQGAFDEVDPGTQGHA